MKRYAVLLTAMTITAAVPLLDALQANRLRRRPLPASRSLRRPHRSKVDGAAAAGPQTPPPPPLTCTSPAAPTDNKVPAALAREGFTAIFNGKDLTGWQALIDIGTLKYGAGLNPADLLKLSPAEKAAQAEGVERPST